MKATDGSFLKLAVLTAWVSTAAALAACSNSKGGGGPSDSGGHDTGVADGSASEAGVDGSDDAVTSAEASSRPAVAGVRLAIWATHALPKVDFCVAPHGTTTFVGPMLYQALQQSDGGDPDAGYVAGLSYPQVSAYFAVPPGRYDARIVAAGASDCSVAVIPDSTTLLPVLAQDGTETLALLDDFSADAGTDPLRIVAFADDTGGAEFGSLVEAGADGGADASSAEGGDDGGEAGSSYAVVEGTALIRFVNAAPNEPFVDFGLADFGQAGPGGIDISQAVYDPYFRDVAFGHAATPDEEFSSLPVDALGYLSVGQFSGVSGPSGTVGDVVVARRSHSQVYLAQASLFADFGSVITLVLLPAASLASFSASGDGGASEALLTCYDTSFAPGTLSSCFLSQ